MCIQVKQIQHGSTITSVVNGLSLPVWVCNDTLQVLTIIKQMPGHRIDAVASQLIQNPGSHEQRRENPHLKKCACQVSWQPFSLTCHLGVQRSIVINRLVNYLQLFSHLSFWKAGQCKPANPNRSARLANTYLFHRISETLARLVLTPYFSGKFIVYNYVKYYM